MLSSTLALTLPLLALTTTASPLRRAPSVQVQFANDVTGANANARIPLDGSVISLGALYGGSELEVDGKLEVTSLQFTADFQNVACNVFKEDGSADVVASIQDPQRDFETFSQKPLDWNTGFGIACGVVETPPVRARARRGAAVPTVRVQFANDVTGANANAWIPLDGTAVSLGEAYAGTELEVNGSLFVTSLEFTANFQNVVCDVLKSGVTKVAHIADPAQDFQTFAKEPVNWQTGFTISCT